MTFFRLCGTTHVWPGTQRQKPQNYFLLLRKNVRARYSRGRTTPRRSTEPISGEDGGDGLAGVDGSEA